MRRGSTVRDGKAGGREVMAVSMSGRLRGGDLGLGRREREMETSAVLDPAVIAMSFGFACFLVVVAADLFYTYCRTKRRKAKPISPPPPPLPPPTRVSLHEQVFQPRPPAVYCYLLNYNNERSAAALSTTSTYSAAASTSVQLSSPLESSCDDGRDHHLLEYVDLAAVDSVDDLLLTGQQLAPPRVLYTISEEPPPASQMLPAQQLDLEDAERVSSSCYDTATEEQPSSSPSRNSCNNSLNAATAIILARASQGSNSSSDFCTPFPSPSFSSLHRESSLQQHLAVSISPPPSPPRISSLLYSSRQQSPLIFSVPSPPPSPPALTLPRQLSRLLSTSPSATNSTISTPHLLSASCSPLMIVDGHL